LRAKEILLGFFNGILWTGKIPEKWFLTKVVLAQTMHHLAKTNNVLFSMLYGFKNGNGTRDCLAIPTTGINNSFEKKKQTVAVF
jgi:hypothetical protein